MSYRDSRDMYEEGIKHGEQRERARIQAELKETPEQKTEREEKERKARIDKLLKVRTVAGDLLEDAQDHLKTIKTHLTIFILISGLALLSFAGIAVVSFLGIQSFLGAFIPLAIIFTLTAWWYFAENLNKGELVEARKEVRQSERRLRDANAAVSS